MTEQTRYEPLLKCRNCGALRNDHPHDAKFENEFKRKRFCPCCASSAGWDDVPGQWISHSIWWKPSTWFTGYLVEVTP